jgi:hypothetical protein
MRCFPLIATALLAAAMCLPAQAQWKWRDKTGQVHVSDLPPPRDVADKDVLQRPAVAAPMRAAPAAASAASAASPPALARVDPELEARRKKADQEQTEQQKQEEARRTTERAENCRRAKEQVRSMESGMRIARVNEKGEREFLDDKTIAAEAQRARNIAYSECH